MTVKDATIFTFTGEPFSLHSDDLNEVRFTDIAHALSNQCRFTGHLRDFYSVAQHSCFVAALMAKRGHGKAGLQVALLHDASEAYLSDIARPFKAEVKGYHEIEAKLEDRIFAAFGIGNAQRAATQPDLKECDMIACYVEARDLHNGPVEEFVGWDDWKDEVAKEPTIIPLLPWKAQELFVDMAQTLEIWHG